MRINHNISALKANNQLFKTNSTLDSSLEKLSSGYRINSAADDSAGLAISEKMRTQISGLDQASRNASDGISVIQTAEGALVEVESMLQRMRELAVQSANGIYTESDRKAVQAEINELQKEINRISDTTEFNTMTLLDGKIDRKSYSSNVNVDLVSLSDTVAVGDYKINITQDARQAVMIGDEAVFNGAGSAATETVNATQEGSVNINGETIKVAAEETLDEVFKKLRDAGDTVGVSVFAIAGGGLAPSTTQNLDLAGYTSAIWDKGNRLGFVSREYGSDQRVEVYCDNPNLAKLLGLSPTKVLTRGYDAKATLDYTTNFDNTATVSIRGNRMVISDRNDFEMIVEIEPGTVKTQFNDDAVDDLPADVDGITNVGTPTSSVISVLDAGPMDLQIGANAGQTMSVRIPKVNSDTLGISKINIGTADGASAAVTILDDAINAVSAIRSKLGAYQNRLEHSISNLDTTSENMTESLSRISDVDMAEEMANYTQKNVLAQAGTSMLAQANQRPSSILSLLQQ